MNVSSQTTEGRPSQCPLCGKKVWTSPSQPAGDATCPHCGSLLWFDGADLQNGDPVHRLAELGAEIETDDEGQVTFVRFIGSKYNDSMIGWLSHLSAVQVIDVRDTEISEPGAKRLQELLPNVEIRYR